MHQWLYVYQHCTQHNIATHKYFEYIQSLSPFIAKLELQSLNKADVRSEALTSIKDDLCDGVWSLLTSVIRWEEIPVKSSLSLPAGWGFQCWLGRRCALPCSENEHLTAESNDSKTPRDWMRRELTPRQRNTLLSTQTLLVHCLCPEPSSATS